MPIAERAVQEYYRVDDLGTAILAALERAGRDLAALDPAELAPVDEFHVRGRVATAELVRLAEPQEGDRVLDVGCGLGGSARYLAAERGCRVVGLDLTWEYCRAAALLSARLDLEERTTFVQGNALRLPFADACFDLVWTEHVQMNIADKGRFYAEIVRVLRPAGRLAFYDLFQGPGGEPYYPLPWAEDATISALETPATLAGVLREHGLRVRRWIDGTAEAVQWFRQALQRGPAQGRPALSLHLLLGPKARQKSENLLRNLEEGRIVLLEAVLERPSD